MQFVGLVATNSHHSNIFVFGSFYFVFLYCWRNEQGAGGLGHLSPDVEESYGARTGGPLVVDHLDQLRPTGGRRATSCGAPSHAGVEPKHTDMGKHFRMF